MIVSDMDGTFLSTSKYEVPRNIERIRYFVDNGGKFTFATGRISPHVLLCAPNAQSYVNAPAVTCNGMSLYDVAAQTPIKEKFMDSALLSELVEWLYESYPNLAYRGMGRDGIITFQPENPYIKAEMERKKGSPTFIVERNNFADMLFHKLTLRDKNSVLREVMAKIEMAYPDVFNLCFSEIDILEIQPKGISKALMVSELRELLSIKRLYAVGDYENDLEMLAVADVAVCPANAIDEVKEACDLCLCDNDTGVIADLIDILDREY